jgi:ribosomal subunit interface protein
MQPVQIVIRDMEKSTALKDHILQKAEKLTQYYRHIHSIRVVVELPQKHKRNGKLFRVRIDLVVPGKELIVNHRLDQDVYIAIRDAFKALLRQLEDYASIRRGAVKNHVRANFGYISKVFPQEKYGFIQGVDGNEYYFSTTHVSHPHFDQLLIGDMVQFQGAIGSEGMQAHKVTIEKKTGYTELLG